MTSNTPSGLGFPAMPCRPTTDWPGGHPRSFPDDGQLPRCGILTWWDPTDHQGPTPPVSPFKYPPLGGQADGRAPGLRCRSQTYSVERACRVSKAPGEMVAIWLS